MKGFPEERIRAAAKKFDAGWEKGSAPYEYWAMYLEACFIEGAKVGWSLGREGIARIPIETLKAKKKTAKKKVSRR